MNTFVEKLLEYIQYAVVNCAPENEAALRRIASRMILCVNEEGISAKYDEKKNEVSVSVRLIEYVWIVSYTYPILYQYIQERREKDLNGSISFEENKETRMCMSMLEWAHRTYVVGENIGPWPDEFPVPKHPDEIVHAGEPVHVAQEFSLLIIAFVILHEIGHKYLQHAFTKDENVSNEQEKDADRFALDWVLGYERIEDAAREKRTIGIALGMTAFLTLEIHTGHETHTHPSMLRRLYDFAVEYGNDDNSIVWAIAVVFMKLHMEIRGIEAPAAKEGTFKEQYDIYSEVIENSRRIEH